MRDVSHCLTTTTMSSKNVPPNKRRKLAQTNALAGVFSFSVLGIEYNEPNDNIIRNVTSVSSDGRRVYKNTTTLPRFRERVYTSVELEPDWPNDTHEWDDRLPSRNHNTFTYQVKKGKVTRVGKRKLFASASFTKAVLLYHTNFHLGQAHEDLFGTPRGIS
jgi:hypothetical protein